MGTTQPRKPTPIPTYRTAQWLLMWPVMCAIVLFAALNPVSCLVYCAAQSQRDVAPSRAIPLYLCVVDELNHWTSDQLGTSSNPDPSTPVPRAVHELTFLPMLVVVAALGWLFTVYTPRLRVPFMATVPPNPPPKFEYLLFR